MLNVKQIKELKEHLEKAQNPIFYYDNDCDGLCSFLILRRYLGRGRGVAVRSFPDLNAQYARKARELNADYVFVLDKPIIAKEFIQEVSELGLPLVWIDHHDTDGNDFYKEFENVFLYNPAKNSGKEKSSEPVTYWSMKISGKKEDLWLGVVGCIADHHFPDFAEEFAERYHEFWGKVSEPFEAYYGTELGRIARAFNFGLKDSVSNVVGLQNFLISCKGPDEVFSELTSNYSFRKKYNEIKMKYDDLLGKAKKAQYDKAIFFDYSGDLSISSDLSNELSYLYPKKYIAVVYKKGALSNVSMRGSKVKKILEKIIKDFENATGGGHEDAVGARIQTNDLQRFKDSFISELNKK